MIINNINLKMLTIQERNRFYSQLNSFWSGVVDKRWTTFAIENETYFLLKNQPSQEEFKLIMEKSGPRNIKYINKFKQSVYFRKFAYSSFNYSNVLTSINAQLKPQCVAAADTNYVIKMYLEFQPRLQLQRMRKLSIFVVFSLVCLLAPGQIIPTGNLRAGTPRDLLANKIVNPLEIIANIVFAPLIVASQKIEVQIAEINSGLNGVALKQLFSLYPAYVNSKVIACSYLQYGTSRIYNFTLESVGNTATSVISSVQSGQQYTSEPDQESTQSSPSAENFTEIKTVRAYDSREMSAALKNTIRRGWSVIKANSLSKAEHKYSNGKSIYRFYFHNIDGCFEYDETSDPINIVRINLKSNISIVQSVPAAAAKSQPVKSLASINLKTHQNSNVIQLTPLSPPPPATVATSAPVPKIAVKDAEQTYLSQKTAIYSVKATPDYSMVDISKFKTFVGYKAIICQLNKTLGSFNQSWIAAVNHTKQNGIDYFGITINFHPFLVQQDYEAHYYGNINKAALLKTDERVFASEGQSFADWNQVSNFSDYKAFKQANEFILYNFNWLRLYNVSAAYTALHRAGRYVRLVYTFNQSVGVAWGGNQVNIVVYVDCGKYYMDRNDFLATNTKSFGRNDWVSLFVKAPNVTQHQYHNRLVNFFESIYPKVWTENQIQDIYFHNDLHIIVLRNPTNTARLGYCVVTINTNNIQVLNNFQWHVLADDSPIKSSILSYVHGKYNISKPLFINFNESESGIHFQICYLNQNNKFAASYLRYIHKDDVFTEDTEYDFKGISYGIDFNILPVPSDFKLSIRSFLKSQEKNIIAIISCSVLTQNSYECDTVVDQKRWVYTLVWAKGGWTVKSKSPKNDGYALSTGYPSISAAAASGYLSRLYPGAFSNNFKYVLIESNNIGLFLYSRLILNLNGVAYQGVVKSTYSIGNSHSLISWDRTEYCASLAEYGFVLETGYYYGYPSSYFYGYSPVQSTLNIVARPITAGTDTNCLAWSAQGECTSCCADYALGNNGLCTQIVNKCLNWVSKDRCAKCVYGYTPSPIGGQCMIFFGSMVYPF